MSFDVQITGDAISVQLRGWDRLMNWRRTVIFPRESVQSASVQPRSALEEHIHHRAAGWGTHNGEKRPGWRRTGTMIGLGVAGKQFWAAPSSPGGSQLILLELADHEFARAVLAVEDLDSIDFGQLP